MQPVPWRIRFACSLPAFALAVVGIPIHAYIPKFCTDVVGAGVFSVFLAWTLITVPYESLGPEISFDHDERTTILSLRDGMLILGTVVAAASPALVQAVLGLGDDAAGERAMFRAVALLYIPLIIVACLICAGVVRERARNVDAVPSSNPLRDMMEQRRAGGSAPDPLARPGTEAQPA